MLSKIGLMFFVCIAFFSHGQQQNGKYTLHLTGNESIGNIDKREINQEDVSYQQDYYIIQFQEIPSEKIKSKLKKEGIKLLSYVPEYAYYAVIQKEITLSLIDKKDLLIRDIITIEDHFKIAESLQHNNVPEWVIQNGNKIYMIVHFYEAPTGEEMNQLNTIGEVTTKTKENLTAEIQLPQQKIRALAQLSFVKYIEPLSPAPMVLNGDATPTHRANVLKSNGLSFDGTGVTVSVGDAALSSSHVDLKNRITFHGGGGLHGHASHVVGITGGAGNINPRNEGTVRGVMVRSYTQYEDLEDAKDPTKNISVTNHSLGGPCSWGYNNNTEFVDKQAHEYSFASHVVSAGNDGEKGGCGAYGTGYGSVAGGRNQAKNIILVGDLNKNETISPSSSRGPAIDGRLKPDICAVGSYVNSTQNTNEYNMRSGTSMAAPAVTGVLAQLIQAYRQHNNDEEPTSKLLKAMILNTADDLGNVGPDYIYGWGRVNARRAYQVIQDQSYATSDVANGETQTHNITIPANVKEAKIMIVWMDKEASSSLSKTLINDLDLVVTHNGTTHKPWELVPTSPSTEATKGEDHLNNVEQVSIDNPTAGTYTVEVKGGIIPSGNQDYQMVYYFVYDDLVVTHPIGGEKWESGFPEYIRWDAYGTQGTFDIEYTLNGVTWNTIATGISGEARNYFWTPPATLPTGKAKIRITRNGVSDESDQTFVIANVPKNLKVISSCSEGYVASWDPVEGAQSYTFYQLGDKYMDSVGTSSSTSIFIPSSAGSTSYIAVCANANGKHGLRTIAVPKTSGSSSCTQGIDLAVSEVFPNANSCVPKGSLVDVSTELINFGLTDAGAFDLHYQLGNGEIITQNILSLEAGQSLPITFTEQLQTPTNGSHSLKIWITLPEDVSSSNNTKTVTVDFDETIYQAPLTENFDAYNNCSAVGSDCHLTCDFPGDLWKNVSNTTDNIDWRVFDKQSSANPTGPSTDHTTGDGKFVYVESSQCQDQQAILSSGCIELINPADFEFWYHMYGEFMGELEVTLQDNKNQEIVLAKETGDKGDVWKKMNIDLSKYKGQIVKLNIKSTTTFHHTSDMAIDDIAITDKKVDELTLFADKTTAEICQEITFTGIAPTGNSALNWNFGTNASPQTATGEGPHMVSYSTEGFESVTLVSDTETKTLDVVITQASKVPTVAIGAVNGLSTCEGDVFEFEVKDYENGGTSPVFTWYVNDEQTHVGNAYSIANVSNQDQVYATIQSDESCLMTNTASSNVITLTTSLGTQHTFYLSDVNDDPTGTWTISQDGNLVVSNSNYNSSNNVLTQNFCLEDGCYEFSFENAFDPTACDAAEWNSGIAYQGGAIVAYNGNKYRANFWTQGNTPDQSTGQWSLQGTCADAMVNEVFGLKSTDEVDVYFEVATQDYTTPYTKSFCVDKVTTINEANKMDENRVFSITPNPYTDYFILEFFDLESTYELVLTDLNGNVKSQQTLTTNKVKIGNDLPLGFYIGKISIGQENYIFKVLKN